MLSPSCKSTQLCGCSIFNRCHCCPCNGSPPFLSLFPPPSLSYHCLDGWCASPGCLQFHSSTSSLNLSKSSARTHNHFSEPFYLNPYNHLPSICFQLATASTSNSFNSSDSSSCMVLGIAIAPVPCTPSLRVKNFISGLPSIQPARSAASTCASRYVPRLGAISVTW